MSKSTFIWAGAASASLATHAGAAALLVWVTSPEDIPQQSTPETRMELAAFQVPQTKADSAEPEAENLSSSDVEGAKLGQNAVPTARAEAEAPSVESAPALPARGENAQSLEAGAPSVIASQLLTDTAMAVLNQGQRVSDTALSAERATAQNAQAQNTVEIQTTVERSAPSVVSATSLETTQLAAVTAAAQALDASVALPVENTAQRVGVIAPEVQASGTTDPRAEIALSVAPTNQLAVNTPPKPIVVALTQTNADEAPAVSPPTTSATATLAFLGQDNASVDPVSLAAFQSFMAPGDLGAAAADVKDSISGVLSSVPCSRLQARFDPDANVLVMTGHVPEDSARTTILSAMQEKMGADIPVREELLVLPRPQCGALTGIAQVGLPQSTDQITNPLLLGAGTHVREFNYTEGQALVLDIQGADYDAYVYVDYFDADGNVVHLKPNEFRPLVNTSAKAALRIGSPRPLSPGEPGLYIKIGPPFGQEIAVAFAASEPLYEGIRPLVEPADAYLEWLQGRVSLARETNPDFKGEWVYFFISTGPAP